jgi:Tfp pilus assembly protein PilV
MKPRQLNIFWQYKPYPMKRILYVVVSLLVLFVIFFASCKNETKVAGVNNTADTTGMAQKIIDSIAAESQMSKDAAENQASPVKQTSQSKITSSSTAEPKKEETRAVNNETQNEAKEKKGLSKTAKGAIIGGVVGAGTGAVVNKNNRAAGAVIGGVVGAGAGAVIGNELDKKDGRH